MFLSDGQHDAVYYAHLLFVYLPRHQSHQGGQPGFSALFLHVVLDGKSDNPLAACSVADIFPLRPDSFFEKHVISVRHDLLNRVNIVVHAPEVLDGAEAVDLMQDVFVVTPLLALLLFLVVTQRVNVPEGPSAKTGQGW